MLSAKRGTYVHKKISIQLKEWVERERDTRGKGICQAACI